MKNFESSHVEHKSPINKDELSDNDFLIKLQEKIGREQTPDEIEMVNRINDYMSEFLEEYGAQCLKIPLERIIFTDENKVTKELRKKFKIGSNPEARAYPSQQLIVVFPPYPQNYPLIKTELAEMLVHELIHLNSFTSTSKRGENFKVKQSGVDISLPDRNFLKFLNEALVEEAAIKFAEKYFPKIAPLAENMQEREAFIKSMPEKTQKMARRQIAYIFTRQSPSGNYKTTLKECSSYKPERKDLWDIIEEIYARNQTKFASQEAILDILISATLAGNVPQIARFFEQHLGRGSFKKNAQRFSEQTTQQTLKNNRLIN
jgi:hypothetical protein